jgi:hypothetical protein
MVTNPGAKQNHVYVQRVSYLLKVFGKVECDLQEAIPHRAQDPLYRPYLKAGLPQYGFPGEHHAASAV